MQKPRILIVDDEPTNLRILVDSLRADYECLTAINGRTSIQLANKANPDLILLDIMMPEMDGYEVCRQLKESASTSHIPVVFATAMNQMEDEKKGLDLGASDYVVKPFRIPILRRRIRHLIDLKKQQDALNQALDENKELLHILCHDLVNPIFAIQNLTYLIERCDDSKAQHFLRLIDRSCQNSLDVIKMVRSIRKLEEKGELLALEPVNLNQAIEESLQTLKAMFEEKNLEIELKLGDDLYVEANYTLLLNSVLNNILTNAAKFSYDDSKISIESIIQGEQIHLLIKDSGIGMNSKLLHQIFKVGGTVSRPGTRQEKGTGFGIPLVQKTMHRFGGELKFESYCEEEHPDKHGTTAKLVFQRAQFTQSSLN